MRAKRFVYVLGLAPVFFSMAWPDFAAAAVSGYRSAGLAAKYGHLSSLGRVDVRRLNGLRRVGRAASPPRYLAPLATSGGGGTVTRMVAASLGGQPQPEVLTSFAAMSLRRQTSLPGSDQGVEPPDTQVAAGPDTVVEAVNSNLTVWSKGGTLLASGDLNTFFALPAGLNFSDPRI